MKQATNDISIFLNQWEIYQRVVDANFMAHQQIKAQLKASLKQRAMDSFSVLDFGCSDASMMTDVLHQSTVSSYMGIDLSAAALTIAAENTQKKSLDARFEIGDRINNFKPINPCKVFAISGY